MADEALLSQIFQKYQEQGAVPAKLDFQTFCTVMQEALRESKDEAQELLSVFKYFDPEGTGYLSVEKISHILRIGGKDFPDEKLKEMLGTAVNSEGCIEYRWLVDYLLGPPQEKLPEAKAAPEEEADAKEAAQCTDIIEASQRGLVGAVRHFVRMDPKCVEKKAFLGWTALHIAAYTGHRDTAELLLQHGAEVEAKDKYGHTALHLAAGNGRREMAELLLCHGAEVAVKDRDGKTPADVADEEGKKDTAALLRSAAPERRSAAQKEVAAPEKARDEYKKDEEDGACRMTIHMTLQDRPAVSAMADTQEIPYEGKIIADAAECIVSFPGKYAAGWDALIQEFGGNSVACVFLTTPDSGLGQHAADPDAPDKLCYCHRIYGKRGYEALGYLVKVEKPYTEEKMAKAEKKAKATNAIVLRADASPEERERLLAEAERRYNEGFQVAAWGCQWFEVWKERLFEAVKNNQRLLAVYFPGQIRQGHIEWEQLNDDGCKLWDGVGLGGSQKCEIAFLQKMRREQDDEKWDFGAIDVADFLQKEFPEGHPVDAWHEATGSWQRGHVVGFLVKNGQKLGEKVTTWTIETKETQEQFESRHVRHVGDAIHRMLNVDDDRLLAKLQEAMPEVRFEGVEHVRLRNGNSALGLKVRVPGIHRMHQLRDKVLNGNTEVSVNHHLCEIRGDYAVQVDQSDFFRQYEQKLHTLSELTPHQKSKLQELGKHKDVLLSAPPGAGKTFVAVQHALLELRGKQSEKILYVAPSASLGLFFVQWLIKRHHAQVTEVGGDWKGALDDLLTRVHLWHEPYVKLVSLRLQAGSLVPVEANAGRFSLALLDEAQELFSTKRMINFYQSIQANRKLVLGDAAQATKWNPDEVLTGLHEVKLTEVIRSTKRINAGALAFQANKMAQEIPSCGGTDGPPLKSFIFECKETGHDEMGEYCSNIKKALWHVIHSFPCLGSLHRRVAMIVPDGDFLEKILPPLDMELQKTFPYRRFKLISFKESVMYLPVHLQPSPPTLEAEGEVLVLDALDNCRGLESMIVICVGLDQQVAGTDAGAARARIYVGITRANLMAIVVDRFVPGGWLEFLSTLKLKKDEKFEESSALGEVNPTAATRIIQGQGRQSRKDQKTALVEADEASAPAARDASEQSSQTSTHLARQQGELQPRKSPEEQAQAQSENLKKVQVSEKVMDVELAARATSVWDTDSNFKPAAGRKLEFDPWQELRQPWLDEVEEDLRALVPEAMKADREVVLAAVKADPMALEYASEELRADRGFVLELVRATKAAFLTTFAAEELRSDGAFVAQCRAAVPGGIICTFYHSSSALDTMRNRFPVAMVSVPGGEAYYEAKEELKRTDPGMATVWFGDMPVWGAEADGKKWIHPPYTCGRHHQPVPPPGRRHPMWDAKIESRKGDEEPKVGSTYPCWCCAWIEELKKKAEGHIICCATSNIYKPDWVEKYGAGSSELSDAKAKQFGLQKETFRNGPPEGWGEGIVKITGRGGGEFSRTAPVHPSSNLPLGEGCRWERRILDQVSFPVYAFFQP